MIVGVDGTDGKGNDGGCYANNDYHEWLELSYQENKLVFKSVGINTFESVCKHMCSVVCR